MNILFLTPDYYPNPYGGIGVHAYYLAQELSKLGHKITVIAVRVDYFISSEYCVESSNGVKVIKFLKDSKLDHSEVDYLGYRCVYNSLIAIKELSSFLADNRFDIVHIHDYHIAILYDYIERTYHTPSVATLHGITRAYMLGDSLRRYIAVRANYNIYISKDMEIIHKKRYAHTSPGGVIYNGICINKSELHHTIKENTITFCGRLVQQKGVDTLIQSFAKVNSIFPDLNLKLQIIGDGEMKEELINLARELDITSNVIFSGYLPNDEARQCIEKAIIHVVPSFVEPFGISALEAMAEGTSVIVARVGGLKEIVQDKESGLLFEAGNVQELADEIAYLLSHPDERNILVENAFKVAQKFSWESVALQTNKVYEEVINEE